MAKNIVHILSNRILSNRSFVEPDKSYNIVAWLTKFCNLRRAGAPRPGLIFAALFVILLAVARAADDSPSTEPSSTVQPNKSTTAPSTSEASTEKADPAEKGEREAVQPDEQHQVAILKQINRVNDDGSYTFGYEAADGSFKIETRDVLGHVKGMFGYIDEQGNLKRVSYSAANGTGFSQANGVPEGATAAANADVTNPLYHQVVRSALESSGPTAAATEDPVDPPTRPPVLIVPRQRLLYTSTQRPEVIQQIPRRTTNEPLGQPEVHFVPRKESVTSPAPLPPRRHHLVTPKPQPDGSTPTPAPYGQYIREPVMEVFVTRSNSSVGNPVTSTTRRPVLVLATPIPGQPLKRLLVTRRPYEVHQPSELPPADDAVDAEIATTTSLPVEGREGNDLRRQLGPDRDIDPIGLVPGVNQLFKIRQPGTADAGDVYPTASGGAGGPLPLSSAALGSTPLVNVLTQHPRALHNEYLQKQILGDLDLRPRVRPAHEAYPAYDERPTPAPTRVPPPPSQYYPPPSPSPSPAPSVSPHDGYSSGPTVLPPLEPSIARALEQFLLARGIRLKVNTQPAVENVPAYDQYVPAPVPVYPRRPAYARVPYVPAPSRYRGYDPYYDGDYDYDPYIVRPAYYMRRVPATYLPVPVAPASAPGYDRYDRYDDPLLVPANRYGHVMDARYPAAASGDELLIRMLLGGRTRALVQPEIQLSDYETSVASATSTSSPQTTTTQASPLATDRGRNTYQSSSTTPSYPNRRRPSMPRTVVRSVSSTGARNVKIIEPEPTAESERIVTSTRAQ